MECTLKIVATITFEQYAAVLGAMAKVSKPTRRRIITWIWRPYVIVSVVIFTLAASLSMEPPANQFVLISLGSAAVVYIMCRYYSRRRVQSCIRRAFDVQDAYMNGQVMEITQSGITGETADGESGFHYKWSAFQRVLRLPDALVFLLTYESFVRIPTESLSLDEQHQIGAWSGLKP